MNYEKNFKEIGRIVELIYDNWKLHNGIILTEGDLQGLFFKYLNDSNMFCGVYKLKDGINYGSKVHLELKWYDDNGKLAIRPDITIVDPAFLLINSTGGCRFPSKGYSFDGKAILIELKFHRGKSEFNKKVKEGIRKDKKNIRTLVNRHLENIQIFEVIFDRSSKEVNSTFVSTQFDSLLSDNFNYFYKNLP